VPFEPNDLDVFALWVRGFEAMDEATTKHWRSNNFTDEVAVCEKREGQCSSTPAGSRAG
jgi:hypothetical protein